MARKKKGRGRPKLKRGDAKSVLIQVRVTPEEAKAIEAQAEQQGRPRSEWIRRKLVPGDDPSNGRGDVPKE
ncbi:MAG: ribbon-helix-helix protein, CopG family [Candidatus Brocadiae bacterium]|nr:ribbon-helix-helix protein, CopG family [Candidatus Brocadiia bacterium]